MTVRGANESVWIGHLPLAAVRVAVIVFALCAVVALAPEPARGAARRSGRTVTLGVAAVSGPGAAAPVETVGATAIATTTSNAAVAPAQAATPSPSPTILLTLTGVAPEPTQGIGLATSAPAVEREERPIVVVRDFSVSPEHPSADTTFRLTLHLKNVGEHFAENIQVGFHGDTFVAGGSGAMVHLNKLPEGAEKSVEADLRVSAGAVSGTHALGLSLRWDDSYGGSYSDEATIGIEVGGRIARPIVIVTAARLPARVAPGAPFELGLDVLNTGGREARNLTVAFVGAPLAPVGGGSGGAVNVAPGAAASMTFRVVAAALAQPGAASQGLELRYDDPDGARYTESQTVGLVVVGEAASGPIPIVESYAVEPKELHPGRAFTLRLELVNVGTTDCQRTQLVLGGGAIPTGGESAAASASSAGAAFAPVGTGNVRYLDRLRAGESRQVQQEMVVAASAKPGVYTLNVGLAFVDENGAAQSTSQGVTLLVSREVKLKVNPIDVVTSTVVGRPVPLNFDVINEGTDEVNVTTAEILPGRYMTVEGGSQFIGPLDGGSPYGLSATLTGTAPTDKAEVKVVVHFLDDFGQEQSISHSFVFAIEPRPKVSPEGAPAREADGGGLLLRVVRGLLGLGASPPIRGLDETGGEPTRDDSVEGVRMESGSSIAVPAAPATKP